jgi:hypothetical protein
MIKKIGVEGIEISSLDEYLGHINRKHASDKRLPAIFRGQSENLPLLPKLARLYNDSLLRRSFAESEEDMLKDFERQAAIYTSATMTRWELMSLAQHHGMATRLLDWTENPLLAIWFAVRKPAVEKQPAVVWIFNPTEEDYIDVEETTSIEELKRTKVLVPRHSSARVRVQAGMFTVHFFIEKEKKFIPLEKNKAYKPRLEKFLIEAGNFPSIRSDLDRCGINAGTMFPDLSGLAAHVGWKHSDLKDESLV